MSTRVQGIVSRLDGGNAIVEIQRSSGCGRCHEPGGCGGTTLATGSTAVRHYTLPNHIDAHVGDQVWLEVADGSVLNAAFWAYGVPGGLMLVLAFLATKLFASDMAAFIGALAGLAVGYGILRLKKPASACSTNIDGREVLSMHVYP
jgi:sigma-E factor negative regulatory protein RseC